MDTTQELQEPCNYINFIKLAEVLRVLHLETNLWAKVQSEQMSFQSAMQDMKSVCCPDVNGELANSRDFVQQWPLRSEEAANRTATEESSGRAGLYGLTMSWM